MPALDRGSSKNCGPVTTTRRCSCRSGRLRPHPLNLPAQDPRAHRHTRDAENQRRHGYSNNYSAASPKSTTRPWRRLAESFGLAPMLGKRLAIVGDARLGKTDNAIVEKLLMISGEDPVTVNRKGLAEINVKLDTRIMIVSNSMPDLKDTTGALASRFLPLRIRIEGFYGKEDRN